MRPKLWINLIFVLTSGEIGKVSGHSDQTGVFPKNIRDALGSSKVIER